MEYSNPPRCPFCDEPAVKTMAGNITVFRCGTEGPHEDDQYQTGRICDMTTYLRVIEKQRQEIERLQAELAFLHSQFQLHSPKMDGQHSWRFRNSGWPMTHAKGPTVEAAIQAAMAEVAREQQAAKGGQA